MTLLGSEEAGIGSIPTAAGPDSPGVAPAPTPSSSVPMTFKCAVDWRTPGFYNFAMPTIPGKRLMIVAFRSAVDTRDATVTTGPTWLPAQNGVDLSTSAVGLNAAMNAIPAPFSLNSSVTNCSQADLSTNVLQIHVTVGAAGAGLTTCTGAVYLTATYI